MTIRTLLLSALLTVTAAPALAAGGAADPTTPQARSAPGTDVQADRQTRPGTVTTGECAPRQRSAPAQNGAQRMGTGRATQTPGTVGMPNRVDPAQAGKKQSSQHQAGRTPAASGSAQGSATADVRGQGHRHGMKGQGGCGPQNGAQTNRADRPSGAQRSADPSGRGPSGTAASGARVRPTLSARIDVLLAKTTDAKARAYLTDAKAQAAAGNVRAANALVRAAEALTRTTPSK
ncbi:hypothetical protein [Deinococcus sp.]|uniref:hypothetical protein n=1 Tax=Deinococcus sp. TaxID=47478 RepID=UPI002869BF86|nr:hypothetical protein [Deinococcus sp.]